MSKFHFCDNFSDNILKSKMLPKLKNARLFPSHRDIFFLKKSHELNVQKVLMKGIKELQTDFYMVLLVNIVELLLDT